jgi:TRAP-type C4-dicarboxylate transport system permease small subunit
MMESYVTRSRQRFGVEFFRNLLKPAGQMFLLLVPNIVIPGHALDWNKPRCPV